MRVKTFLLIILPLLVGSVGWAQSSQPIVGRDAATKYFQKRDVSNDIQSGGITGANDHYLALHYGRLMSSQSYDWGKNGQEDDVGKNNFGVTYRIGEWVNSMDMNIRIDYMDYEIAGEKPTKLSFLPLITFPDANSRFPLYFGAGLGLGVFLKQINEKSAISLDYQLVAGARFFNVFENTGFFIEAGLKNSLFILSSGQYNGTFLAGGLVFTF
ncbi:hypothetical protein AZI86_17835 [Bdellovibrio bacteriovorus]|uniref:Outer membrane protein beta-barrel domain-containing protein n=1 Tax=Bdellovibrio bacteriovorus TaxID=959 RepID=A0A150WEN9_BDEBC|nr:hypothetical protein AZI86_17835 [Bdellovibrio bacteriovorus]